MNIREIVTNLNDLAIVDMHKFVDFFAAQYRIVPLDEMHLNTEINSNPRFKRAMQTNISEAFWNQILVSITTLESNHIIQVNGKPNMGKSVVALAIALRMKQMKDEYNQRKHIDRETKVHITFDIGQTTQAIYDMQDGDICLQDETEELAGAGSKIAIQNMNNLINTIRATGKSMLLVSPNTHHYSSMNLRLEPIGSTRLLYIQGRTEIQEIRVLVYYVDEEGDSTPLGFIIINLHDLLTSEFYQDYLRQKRGNIERLQRDRGLRGVNNSAYIEEQAIKLYQAVQEDENCNRKKNSIKAVAKRMGIQGSTDDFDTIIQTVYERFQQNNSPEAIFAKIREDVIARCLENGYTKSTEVLSIVNQFPDARWLTEAQRREIVRWLKIDTQETLSTQIQENIASTAYSDLEIMNYGTFVETELNKHPPADEITKTVAIMMAKGSSIREIAERFNRSDSFVRPLRKQLLEGLLADLTEKYAAYLYGIEHISGTGVQTPDFIDSEGYAHSVKLCARQKGEITYNVETDCNPELSYTRDAGLAYFFLDVVNLLWNDNLLRSTRIEVNAKLARAYETANMISAFQYTPPTLLDSESDDSTGDELTEDEFGPETNE